MTSTMKESPSCQVRFNIYPQVDGDSIIISLKAWGIDDSGMLGIGFGGLSMTDAQVMTTLRLRSFLLSIPCGRG